MLARNRITVFNVTLCVGTRRLFLIAMAASAINGAFTAKVQAQTDQLVVYPPLGQAFPLDPKQDGMHVQYPVLINNRTILSPDAQLRFIYYNPNTGTHGVNNDDSGGGGAGGGGGKKHHGGGGGGGGGDNDAGSAYSRDAGGPGGAGGANAGVLDGMVDPNKGAKTEISTEVWMNAQPFREALDQATDLGTT